MYVKRESSSNLCNASKSLGASPGMDTLLLRLLLFIFRSTMIMKLICLGLLFCDSSLCQLFVLPRAHVAYIKSPRYLLGISIASGWFQLGSGGFRWVQVGFWWVQVGLTYINYGYLSS